MEVLSCISLLYDKVIMLQPVLVVVLLTWEQEMCTARKQILTVIGKSIWEVPPLYVKSIQVRHRSKAVATSASPTEEFQR